MRKSIGLLLVLVFLMVSCLVNAVPALSSDEIKENFWAAKAPMPEAGGDRAAVVNGRIYVIGREANYEYNPDTDTWDSKKPMPTPRSWFGLAVYQNKIYTIGGSSGWTQETGSIYSSAIEVYDPSTDTWETKEPMPINRSTLWANVVCGKIHLIADDTHDIYDIATGSWTTAKATPLINSVYIVSSTVFNDKIYFLGGNVTQIYDPENDSWSLGTAAPIRVSTPGVCATIGVMAPKRIYVFGGTPSFLEVTNVTQVYDPESDTWTLGAPMFTARAGLAAAVVNDVIYAIGGGFGWGETTSANEQYVPIGYGEIEPVVSVLSPQNITYSENSVPLTFTVDKPASWTEYSLDEQDNVTVNGNATLSDLLSGQHNITVYAKYTLGSIGASEIVYFNVEVPEPFPTLPVLAASVAALVVVAGLLVYFKKRKR